MDMQNQKKHIFEFRRQPTYQVLYFYQSILILFWLSNY